MIGFDLNEEQLRYQKVARTFAEKEMKPYAAELDRRQGEVFDLRIIRRFARANLLGLAQLPQLSGYFDRNLLILHNPKEKVVTTNYVLQTSLVDPI